MLQHILVSDNLTSALLELLFSCYPHMYDLFDRSSHLTYLNCNLELLWLNALDELVLFILYQISF